MSKWIESWIDTGDGPMPEKAWQCPVCNSKFWRRTNYCPNCGTDMRELERF